MQVEEAGWRRVIADCGFGPCGVNGHGSGMADPSGPPDGSGAHREMTRDFGVVIPETK